MAKGFRKQRKARFVVDGKKGTVRASKTNAKGRISDVALTDDFPINDNDNGNEFSVDHADATANSSDRPILIQKTLMTGKVGKNKERRMRKKEKISHEQADLMPRSLRDLIYHSQKRQQRELEEKMKRQKEKDMKAGNGAANTSAVPSFYEASTEKSQQQEQQQQQSKAKTTNQTDRIPVVKTPKQIAREMNVMRETERRQHRQMLQAKHENPLANVKKRDDESLGQFKARVNAIMKPYIQDAIREPNMKQKKEKNKKKTESETNPEHSTKKLKEDIKGEKAPHRTSNPESLPDEKTTADADDSNESEVSRDFSDLKDEIKFGEIVHEPPSMSKEKKLTSAKLGTFHFAKLLNPEIARKLEAQNKPQTLRDEVIAKYREMKRQKRGHQLEEGEYL
eukprot:TRINITY_DN5609_c0_g1_i1.p1 TRINITY_DN5609_c0_g1~~TRINITY_DN5609_c0_g1_i1.p1  ORF type:complete len:395 (+),score=117.22 TRINITY_DN5609_c0_g1_i1:45-1229(+)